MIIVRFNKRHHDFRTRGSCEKYAIPYMAKHLRVRLYLTVEHYNIQELNAGIQPSTH